MAELTPWQWLARLGRELTERQDPINRWEDYYRGDQDLPAGPQQNADTYKRFQRLARTNLCRLCVDSMVQRMSVIGYRDGTDEDGNDAAVWDLWQRSRMDSRQHALFRKALRAGRSYAIVAPDPANLTTPRVTIEDAKTVITATDPADSSKTLAALRLWFDAYGRRWFATVWIPGARYSFQTLAQVPESAMVTTDSLSFSESAWQARGQYPSPMDLPVIEFSNADEGDLPVAEFDAGMDVQNRLNLTLLNRLTAERYSSFRQRFLMNYVPEEDPVTGLPIAPFNPGADQTLTVPPPEPGQPEPRLGDLAQTDTQGMLHGTEADMRAFAALTVTPVYYLPGDLTNIGADTVAALDAGHNAKIRQRMTAWGEQLERVLQHMADIAGLDRDLSSSELVWQRPENLNLAQVAAYAQTLRNTGYPLPVVAERIGETPQQIEALRAELAAEQMRTQMMQPPQQTAPNAAGQPQTGPATPEAPPAETDRTG